MKKTSVIYFHGLGSKAESPKLSDLRAGLESLNVEVIARDHSHKPDEVIVNSYFDILSMLDKDEKVVLVGTSFGGFFATFLGEAFKLPYVIVNPATNPAESFKKYSIDPPVSYATGEKMIFTEEDFETLTNSQVSSPSKDLANVFLAKDDDVVPFAVAQELFDGCNVVITEDGGHRYESNWRLVVSRVVELVV